MKQFGEILGELRRENALNQRTVSNALGISQALLSHYENGTREPGLNFVRKACEYYGVSSDYLLGLSESRHSGERENLLISRIEASLGDVISEIRSAREDNK
ncbi:MAG: helix-turn-helix domain-containing protein [Oscillospiraceae bacterium]|nr:helix-turn-helix domain-containing protein [Oscillospiraceae bacterium]